MKSKSRMFSTDIKHRAISSALPERHIVFVGRVLADWLNRNDGTAAYRKVVEMRRDLLNFLDNGSERTAIAAKLNPLLGRYPIYPELISPPAKPDAAWDVVWDSREKGEPSLAHEWETPARRVHFLLTLMVRGKLRMLRTCEWCSKWFFARQKVSTKCSPLCHVKAYAKTTKGIQSHRKAQKNYREQEKKRAARELREAKRGMR
jgi:hypothetical protein